MTVKISFDEAAVERRVLPANSNYFTAWRKPSPPPAVRAQASRFDVKTLLAGEIS